MSEVHEARRAREYLPKRASILWVIAQKPCGKRMHCARKSQMAERQSASERQQGSRTSGAPEFDRDLLVDLIAAGLALFLRRQL